MGKWSSDNDVFGPGRTGDILLRQGGELQTKKGDDIGFAEHGMVIRHNDPADTITLIPWENIAMIRTALTRQAQEDRRRRQLEAAERKTKPVLDLEALKELNK